MVSLKQETASPKCSSKSPKSRRWPHSTPTTRKSQSTQGQRSTRSVIRLASLFLSPDQHARQVSSKPQVTIFPAHLARAQAEGALINSQSNLVGILMHPDIPEGSCLFSGQMTDSLTLKTPRGLLYSHSLLLVTDVVFTGTRQMAGRGHQTFIPIESPLACKREHSYVLRS